MRNALFVAALLALTAPARAESWSMRCHNSVDGSDYDVSWHGDTGALIIASPGKSPKQFFAPVNGRDGWRGTKALGAAHFGDGSQLEAYFESQALPPSMTEGGSHMLYRDALGKVLTRDPCVVTNYW
jgi:hypothetical protein